MNIIKLTEENLLTEHICCAISSKSTTKGVEAKKEWLSKRFKEGLRFIKFDVKGKVFIEYIPAENAWVPVDAEGYILINCFWVSGSFKGKGYGKRLLAECEKDARSQGYKGVVLIVGNKKKPFLSDKAFMLHNGYEVCDTCDPYFELMVKNFDQTTTTPSFKQSAKSGMGDSVRGIDIFYTEQCPFTVPYIKLLEPIMQASIYPVRCHRIETKEAAQNHFSPVTTYSLFVDGKFYTNEILTADKLNKLIETVRG